MAKGKNRGPKKTHNQHTVIRKLNLWAFLESVINHAISKGQLIPLSLFLIVALIVTRLPEEELSKIAFKAIDIAHIKVTMSYALNIVLVIFIAWHARMVRRVKTEEVDRISKEKTDLQEKLRPGSTESSEE